MTTIEVFTVRMPFAARLTFRRWFPVWLGLMKWTGYRGPRGTGPRTRRRIVGIYVRVLSRSVMVQVRQR